MCQISHAHACASYALTGLHRRQCRIGKDGLQPMFQTKPNIQHKRTKILKMYAEREATTNENDVSLYIRNEYFFVVTPSTVYSPYGNGKPLTYPTHTHTHTDAHMHAQSTKPLPHLNEYRREHSAVCTKCALCRMACVHTCFFYLHVCVCM